MCLNLKLRVEIYSTTSMNSTNFQVFFIVFLYFLLNPHFTCTISSRRDSELQCFEFLAFHIFYKKAVQFVKAVRLRSTKLTGKAGTGEFVHLHVNSITSLIKVINR